MCARPKPTAPTPRLLFVGEIPSNTAHRNGWTWESGRLAAKPLFEALRAINIDPAHCGFINIYGENPKANLNTQCTCAQERAKTLKAIAPLGVTIVAMGNKVSEVLTNYEVVHIKLRHPAARGAGRKSAAYHAHVADTLDGKLEWVAW